ncbi:putative component of the Rsx system (modular protein) [Gammaproteobacteria bacterium]
MANDDTLEVEVAYAREDFQTIISILIPTGTTIQQALDRSHIQERCPEIDLKINKVGIFGRIGRLEQVLRAGDRVEIYRPLIADPKLIRKERATTGKRTMQGGDSESAVDDVGVGQTISTQPAD